MQVRSLMAVGVAAVAAAGLVATPAAAEKKVARAYDFNGDGKQDVLVQGSPSIVVYGGSRRKQSLEKYLWSWTSADFDRDGFADLAYSADGPTRPVMIAYGSRTGLGKRSTPVTTAGDTTGLAVGDLDRNGKPDLVVTAGDTYSVIPNVGKGGGAADPVKVERRVSQPLVADFTGDGWPELVLTMDMVPDNFPGDPETGPRPVLLVAKGSAKGLGNAVKTRYEGGLQSATGDFNGDRIPDLVTASGNADVGNLDRGATILYGGKGGFRRAQRLSQHTKGLPGGSKASTFGTSIATGDINKDGRTDLVATDAWSGTVWVIYGGKKGLSVTRAQRITWKTAGLKHADEFGSVISLRDVNGDKRLDLTVNTVTDVNGLPKTSVYVFGNTKGRISAKANRFAAI